MKTPAQDIILAPVITEASMAGIALKKYTFKVATNATKVDVARAAEELFGVKVAKVNTISRARPLPPPGRRTQATRLRPKKPSSPSPRIPRASTSSNPWSKRTWVRAPHKKAPRPQRGRLWRYDSDNNVIRQESEKEHGYQKV